MHKKNASLPLLTDTHMTGNITFLQFHCQTVMINMITGRAQLIRTRLIRSSTWFEVSVNVLLSFFYHFMFKRHGQFEFPLNSKENLAHEWLRINRSRPVIERALKYFPEPAHLIGKLIINPYLHSTNFTRRMWRCGEWRCSSRWHQVRNFNVYVPSSISLLDLFEFLTVTPCRKIKRLGHLWFIKSFWHWNYYCGQWKNLIFQASSLFQYIYIYIKI